jgi:flagellar protein FliO/FliZ
VISFLLAQSDAIGSAGPALVPSLWRTLGALVVVLALIGAGAWLLRRGVIARRAGKGLAVESALSLGERRSLVVVMVEGRRLLLGLAPNSVALVTELDRHPSFDQALTQAAASEPRPS